MPRSHETLHQDPQNASITFYFWHHVKEEVAELMPMLANAEVILLENNPLQMPSHMRVQEALLNKLLGADLTPRQNSILCNHYGDEVISIPSGDLYVDPSKLTPTEAGIVQYYRDSGKTLRFLDVNPKNNPEIVAEFVSTYESGMALTARMRKNQVVSYDEIRQSRLNFINTFGKNIAARDEVIDSQIAGYEKEFAGKRIAVVYGAHHTALSHERIHQNTATRTFVGRVAARQYDLEGQAVRTVRFGKPLTTELIDRVMLMNSLVAYGSQLEDIIPGTTLNDAIDLEGATVDIAVQADKIVRGLSAQAVRRFTSIIESASDMIEDENFEKAMQYVSELWEDKATNE